MRRGLGGLWPLLTCKIAQEFLTKDALSEVKKLLPPTAEGNLAAVCSWPDHVRFLYTWSRALHFADTPYFECNDHYCRDCHDTMNQKDRCVAGAMHNYTNQLEEGYNGSTATNKCKHAPSLVALYLHNIGNSSLTMADNLTEALMFLSHFMGDIHQPLHIGFLGDAGGNFIKLHWYQKETNLHRVWDDMITESALEKFYDQDLSNMIQAIHNYIKDGSFSDIAAWSNCASNSTVCPDPYASKGIELACQYAYTNATAGNTLGDDYFLSRLPIVEKRLAQGGVRLAATLNRIFARQYASIAEEWSLKSNQ